MRDRKPLSLVNNYIKWIEDTDKKGEHRMFIITFLFNHLKIKNNNNIISVMQSDIEKFSSKIITRIIRKPNRLASKDKGPKFILFPDLPVYKESGKTISFRQTNNGLHFHGIAIIPKKSRLKEDLDTHVIKNRTIYINSETDIRHIDIRPITYNSGYVCQYILKHLNRKTFDDEHILILPKSVSELN